MIAALLAVALTAAQRVQIDAIVGAVMHRNAIAGLSLGIARRGKPLYLRGYGWRDVRWRRPADGFTIYAAGSIAKQFTAALVLQDVDDGKLSLDAGSPTVRSLLDQTTPAGWEYDNANYAALGELLESTGGTSYCTLLAQRILFPQHLISSSCGPPGGAWNVAIAAIPPPPEPVLAPAAGGLWTNAPDLLRWLERLRTGRVVSQPDFRMMTTSARLPNGTPVNYGFGFFVDNWYGAPVVDHSGFIAGYSAEDALLLDDGLELALLANASSVDLVPLAKSVAAIVDPPRDRSLVASPAQPVQNENPSVRASLTAFFAAPAFAALGGVQTLEFIERSSRTPLVVDRYRVTFEHGVRWVTVTYDATNEIRSVVVETEEP